MHTVSNITRQNPDGDRGGNSYTIIYKNSKSNLHKLWDSGVGIFEGSNSLDHVDDLAQKIMNKYPQSYFGSKAKDLNSDDWAKEGVENAKNYVYTTPQDKTPTDNYLTTGQEIAEQQAALAGYRLANVLNQSIS